jgi:DNA-binding SARP family transcriptional activator
MKNTVILILLVASVLPRIVFAKSGDYGLLFHSHEKSIDERTSLILNNKNPYEIAKNNEFSIDFDVFLRNSSIKFGYIFRIISDGGTNFDFIVNNEKQAFFVIGKKDFILTDNFLPDQWKHFSLTFKRKQNIVTLKFNNDSTDCPYDLKNVKSVFINFGKCNYKNFQTNDVAPVIIKDIQVKSDNDLLHRWQLDRHGYNSVNDLLKQRPAIANCPHWTIDDHCYWQKNAEFETVPFPQFTFDSIGNNLYILDRGELIKYSLLSGKQEKTATKPPIHGKFYNELMFDPVSSRLMFYRMETQSRFYYNASASVWENFEPSDNEPSHAHHNRFISPQDSSLYIFGGYGFYKYHSDFFKVNLLTDRHYDYDFSHTITPRYLAAMGGDQTGEKLYILGGRGAEMGRQELSPRNFTDLFEVNLKTLKIKYLFDIKEGNPEENIYSNSLVVDKNNIYVLAYSNSNYRAPVTLRHINLDTHKTETLADSIDYYFQDVTSFCDLYYSSELQKIIAVVAFSKDRKTSDINVYTLNYPPLKESDVLQKEIPKGSYAPLLMLLGIIFVFFFIALGYKKIKKTKNRQTIEKKPANLAIDEPLLKDKKYYDTKTSSILFLGGFEVFNNKGKNITGDFTPTLKYMLVLIILHTLKNNKGISSNKLQEILWFDKNEEAARNNRSVNLRKLRVLLQEIGEIDISNDNSYWIISIPETALSDYKESLRLANEILSGEITQKEVLMRLLELLDNGALLPNIQFEWVDNFKTDFSNLIIDSLMSAVGNPANEFYDNPAIQLKVADALLKMDSIHEEAIEIKCRALVKMGKKGLAKTHFESFKREYKNLLGENYRGNISF